MNFKKIDTPTGLYIHIPICKSKCAYCDFYSETGLTNKIQEILIKQIIKQTEYFIDLTGSPEIATIYIGGGTPSLINKQNLKKLLGFLNKLPGISPETEKTIEANPESINREFINICKENYITRISLGIQSFNNRLLNVLGRNAKTKDNLRALSLLRRFWNREVNMDIISGIPGQTISNLKDDLKRIIDSGSRHISVYSLTVSEESVLYKNIQQGEIIQEPEDYLDELWLDACDYLKDNGFNQYEISNFCKPGKESRHNLIYWNMNPYIGMGPGAVSTVPGGPTGIVRISNNENIEDYLTGDNFKTSFKIEEVSKDDFLFENLMMGFRKREGINKKVFEKRFGHGLKYFLGIILDEWQTKSYLEENKDFYYFTDKGRLILNALLRDAFDNLKSPETVNWP